MSANPFVAFIRVCNRNTFSPVCYCRRARDRCFGSGFYNTDRDVFEEVTPLRSKYYTDNCRIQRADLLS